VINEKIWKDVKIFMCAVQFAPFDYREHTDCLLQFVLDAREHINAGHIIMHRETAMPLDFQRSKLAEIAMRSDEHFTHILMYDTDMMFTFSDLVKMLSRNVDCVSATYFIGHESSSGRLFPCCSSNGGVYIPREQISSYAREDKLLPVEIVGCGFLLVRTSLLRKIGQPVFMDEWRIGGETVAFKGEDIYFSHMAAKTGYKLFIDPTVICPHIKTLLVGYDVHTEKKTRFFTPND
jgi:hypothetical protein